MPQGRSAGPTGCRQLDHQRAAGADLGFVDIEGGSVWTARRFIDHDYGVTGVGKVPEISSFWVPPVSSNVPISATAMLGPRVIPA